MANYHIGLDFGTSQTKICLLNTDNGEREFVEFDNASFFLPTLITRKNDGTFSYGREEDKGTHYRYFKMATAEDDDLIQVTNEKLSGDALSNKDLESFRRYNEKYDIKPEILSILYLTYIVLYIKNLKKAETKNPEQKKGALARFTQQKTSEESNFSVQMGIPTEWHNPEHIKRKIKFETILIIVNEFSAEFSNLDVFLKQDSKTLIEKASKINKKHSDKMDSLSTAGREDYINNLLNEYKLSVFPETAAGISFLLATKRLPNGYFAAMDIGAGTSDISIFLVKDNKIVTYLCSESVEIASNNVYSEYALSLGGKNKFDNIKQTEILFRKGKANSQLVENALAAVRGKLQFVIRKIFYRKHFKPLHDNDAYAASIIRGILDAQPIIIYGGGANFQNINSGHYMFFQDGYILSSHNNYFEIKPIALYVDQVEVKNQNKVKDNINLLILALGLSYLPNDKNNHNFFAANQLQPLIDGNTIDGTAKYFYYDIQDAVFK